MSIRICPEPVGYPEQLPRFGMADLTDDGIDRVLREYARKIEDGTDPAAYAPMIRTGRVVKLVRLCLRMRYGATFLGTHQPDRWLRHDEAPSYWLALAVDQHRAACGLPHVLDGRIAIGSDLVIAWPPPSAPMTRKTCAPDSLVAAREEAIAS